MPAETIDHLIREPWPATGDATALLRWAVQEFDGRIALSTSLGPQTLVILELLDDLGLQMPVFALDTGMLFPETYELWEKIEQRYGVRVEAVRPGLTVDEQARRHGDALWKTDPDRCCKLRKVVPLRARLRGLEAWVTGLRRVPGSATRGDIEAVAWDAVNGLFKVNPLHGWSRDDVMRFAQERSIPLNPLLFRGFRSIGCTHCTARTAGGERDGRWDGNTKTECGLHWPTPFASEERT